MESTSLILIYLVKKMSEGAKAEPTKFLGLSTLTWGFIIVLIICFAYIWMFDIGPTLIGVLFPTA
jgi:hypothetical protein